MNHHLLSVRSRVRFRQATLFAASLAVAGFRPAVGLAGSYGFLGGLTPEPSYGAHPAPGFTNNGYGAPDGYAYDSMGSFGSASVWYNSPYPYVANPTGTPQIFYSPSAPGPNDSVTIGGLPAGDFPLVAGPVNNSDPNNPIYGYYGPLSGQLGYLGGAGFNVTGAGGVIANLTVAGPGSLQLTGLNVSTGSSISSIGGIPLYENGPNGGVFQNTFGPSALNITGTSLSTPLLTLTSGTSLVPVQGATPDPVADAGSFTVNAATLSGDTTQILPGATSTDNFIVQPVNLTNGAGLTAKNELDIVGLDNTAAGTVSLLANNSTITAGSIVIATGATGYGSGGNAAAVLNLSGGSTLTGTNTSNAVPSLVVGDSGTGTLSVTQSSTVTAKQVVIGNAAGATGTATVDHSTWTNASFCTIGFYGTGTLNVQNNATLTSNDEMYIGLYNNANGTLAISSGGSVTTNSTGINGTLSTVLGVGANTVGTLTIDGTGSRLQSNGDMSIGYGGTGNATLTNGAALLFNGNYLRVGRNEASNGTLTVDGAGSRVTATTGTLYVGYGGAGVVSVQNQASLTVPATNIGGQETGTGTIYVLGQNTQATLGDTTVGDAGNGDLEFSQNAAGYTNDLTVGSQENSTGNLAVSDPGTSLAVAGELKIGDEGNATAEFLSSSNVTAQMLTVGGGANGEGTLAVDTLATLTVTGDTTVGDEAGSVGNVYIGETGIAHLTVGGNLTVGGGGYGYMTVGQGATLAVSGGTFTIGDEQTATGIVILNGGILTARGDLTIGDSGNGQLSLQAGANNALGGVSLFVPSVKVANQTGSVGTLSLDGSGTSFTVSDLTVGVQGQGTLTLTNGALLTSDGDVSIADQASGVISSATVASSAKLLVSGDLTVGNGGIASMQVSTGGIVTATGNLAFGTDPNSGGSLIINGTAPSQSSQLSAGSLAIGGSMTANGGSGSVTVGSGGTIQINSGVKIWPGGTLNISGGSVTVGTGITAQASTLQINANGSLVSTGSVYLSAVANAGTFNQSGSLIETGNFNNSGTATIGQSQNWSYGSIFSNTAGNATFQTDSGVTNPGPSVNVSGGTVNFASTQHLAGLYVGSAGSAKLTGGGAGHRSMLYTPSLAITGTLDLTNNDLDVQSGGSTALANVSAMVSRGYHNGSWTGTGITSSTAAGDTTHLTALGIMLNITAGNTPMYTTLDGLAVAANDVLVKYTYFGDADLSGTVNSADYSRIDNGYLNHLTGWQNGDFNYDNVINGSDYTLIDNAFNSQGATISAQVSDQLAAITSVPEPSAILVGVGCSVGCLCRRRHRRSDPSRGEPFQNSFPFN
jgi:T5SS/PEP-CTERM-associated repeat protein